MNKRMAKAAPEDNDSAGLRERILRASVELIEAQGLGQLSMREVARRAGVTHQAPYHYFADREAILGAIAEQGFRLLQERIVRAGAVSQELPAVRRLCAAGQAYVEFACDHSAHFRLMFRPELVDPDNCPGAKFEGDCAFNTFIAIVRDAVEAGLPAYPSEPALIALMWSVAHGLACLIVDGPLARKLPNDDGAQRDQIRAVISGLECLLHARMESAAHDTSKPSAIKPSASKAKTSATQAKAKAKPTKRKLQAAY